MLFPWSPSQAFQKPPQTPRELMLERLREGVPPELATRAAGLTLADIKDDPEVDKALAEGEILLFERARDSGVTGVVRAAMRREVNTWQVKPDVSAPGQSLEDLLRE